MHDFQRRRAAPCRNVSESTDLLDRIAFPSLSTRVYDQARILHALFGLLPCDNVVRKLERPQDVAERRLDASFRNLGCIDMNDRSATRCKRKVLHEHDQTGRELTYETTRRPQAVFVPRMERQLDPFREVCGRKGNLEQLKVRGLPRVIFKSKRSVHAV